MRVWGDGKFLGKGMGREEDANKHLLRMMEESYVSMGTSIRYPTWKKNMVLHRTISNLRVRDKRLIFQTMRSHPSVNHDTLFTRYGFTAGEFSTWHILADGCRRKTKK